MTIPKVSLEAAEAFMDAIEPLLLARAESLGEQTPSKSWREHREKNPEMWERDWAIVLAGTEAALSVCESLIRSKVIDEAAGVERREICDRDYMICALVNMLGPNALSVWKAWQDKGVKRVHFSWGPDAAAMTGEERAAVILEMEEARKDAVLIDNVDEHLDASSIRQLGERGR